MLGACNPGAENNSKVLDIEDDALGKRVRRMGTRLVECGQLYRNAYLPYWVITYMVKGMELAAEPKYQDLVF